MTRIWEVLGELPPLARWGILGGAAAIVLLLIGSGVWTLLQYREDAARRAFAAATAAYTEAEASAQDGSLGAAAAADLRRFLKAYPRSRAAAEAWYYLGNVEYRRRQYDVATPAFVEATRRGSPSIAALSRLGLGYSWEAKGDPARALEVYRAALAGREPRDFLYGELLLAMARTQEELKQPGAAIESYKRFLRDVPSSARAEEVRIRLALLGASG